MFNLEKAMKRYGISKSQYLRMRREVGKEFKPNTLEFELHIIRYMRTKKRQKAKR